MKFLFKSLGYIFLSLLVLTFFYLVNLFTKPFSLDHYLNKEITIELIESPEYMTYIGVFDKFNFIFKHKEKLTVPSEENLRKKYLKKLKRLDLLKKYDPEKLSDIQKITQKIAIFDTKNDINQFESFRYHSYLFNQISGNHLNLVEFMTDTHPIKNHNDAISYIKRVKLFKDVLKANLEYLENQKK